MYDVELVREVYTKKEIKNTVFEILLSWLNEV